MSCNGLVVTCHAWSPKKEDHGHDQSRSLCVLQPRDNCPSCAHSRFKLSFQEGIGNQEVACPRWDHDADRVEGKPAEYVQIRREICMTTKPFEWCTFCPNTKAEGAPFSVPGWYEELRHSKKRRAEEDE